MLHSMLRRNNVVLFFCIVLTMWTLWPRLLKLHLVRPDLLTYPIDFPVYA